MNINLKRSTQILFILFFGVLAYFSVGLKLYLDDLYYAYPSYFGDYAGHMKGYFSNYGFFRPLSLLYYYLILAIYRNLPFIAHQIPLLIYLLGIYFFYRLYRLQNLSEKISFLGITFLLSFPWAVEGWAWFSANPSILVLPLLGLQFYLAEKNSLNLKTLLALFILQILTVFIYDTPLLIPISLTYLLLTKNPDNLWLLKNKFLDFIKISLFLFIPTIFNLGVRTYIKPGMEIRFQMISVADALSHWGNMIFFFKSLFTFKAFQEFWIGGSSQGLKLIFANPFTPVLFLLLILIVAKILFNLNYKEHREFSDKRMVIFWLLSFILSLVPLSWQNSYSPFRTFILPALFLISAVLFVLDFRLRKIRLPFQMVLAAKIFFLYLIISFTSLQVHMVDSYIRQYRVDEKITIETDYILKNLGIAEPDSIYLYYANVPNNNIWSYVYGDYILSSYYHYWTAEYFYKIKTGYWKNIAIELDNNRGFLSKYSKEQFLNQKNLIRLNYNGYERCHYDECYEYIPAPKNK